ncbi:MAG: acetylxylan esterase [Planctomycetaceae bacterium]|nr:MAG: acetylxylan esterase [Planctomycetaceae bacterium]
MIGLGLLSWGGMLSLLLWGQELPAVDDLPEQPHVPDLLTLRDGRRVTTADQWWQERRPELVRLIQHYMYGYTPPPPQVQARVLKTADDLLAGRCRYKEVELRFADLPDDAPRIHLALFLPAQVRRPVPIFLALNKCGNVEVLPDEQITYYPETWRHRDCPQPLAQLRGSQADFWCVEYLLSRGYGLATFHESEIDPDQHDFSDGIHPYYRLPGDPRTHWGTIAAWAWGLQRCVDYLVTDAEVDRRRICLIGHSRRGKTALLAAALDQRVALVVPHQSGTGGMALSRDSQQETVERINRVFPHWFNDMFTEFNHREAKLPFDQHALVALVAPRPLLDTEGSQDAWANFPRALDALRAADPVYKLLGAPGLQGRGLVQDDEPIVGPNLGSILQYRRNERHTLNRGYWEKILDFADAVLPQ